MNELNEIIQNMEYIAVIEQQFSSHNANTVMKKNYSMHSKEHFLDSSHVKQLRNRKGFPQTVKYLCLLNMSLTCYLAYKFYMNKYLVHHQM